MILSLQFAKIKYFVKNMLFAGREVRIGKNCARGLEYGPRPQAEGRTQDRLFIFFSRKVLFKQFLC